MHHTCNETAQLLQWIRKSVTSPRWNGLQDLANGVVWCRLMAKVLPGSIASVLIIHRPANERDAMHNYILLQGAFGKVNTPWYFDVKKLVAGNQSELLKLGQSMARMGDARNIQLQQEKKNSMQQRLSRFPAGELETPQEFASPNESLAAPMDAQSTSKQQQPPVSTDQEPTPFTAVQAKSELKQQIQTLYHNQQLVMAASMNGGQPLPAQTVMDPTAAFRPPPFALCLCSNCIASRQKLDSTADTTIN
ncbi:hypothetical protein KR044_000176 [Drosophila immigrans]|nr:hypothetical protein KR044_000176 [Drosophila immigrans]